VARCAGRERGIPRNLAAGEVVAFLARHLGVPSAQRIACAIVIERRAVNRVEGRRRVAAVAARAELAVMRVGVAR